MPEANRMMREDWNGHDIPKDTFINRPPQGIQGPTYDAVTAVFNSTGDVLTQILPPGRYASLCLTALEEACMWAKKCVALDVNPDGPGRAVALDLDSGDHA